jgi:hypothetical protein
MKRLMIALAASALGVGYASAADNLVTCAQFKERLAKADKVFGGTVPRFRFEEFHSKHETQDIDLAYTIEGTIGISGELDCDKKTGRLRVLSVDLNFSDGDNSQFAATARFMVSALAVTWAYTDWPKRKVQEAVGRMIREAHDEVDAAELRGDKDVKGEGSFDIAVGVDMTYTIAIGSVRYILDASTSGKAT